jgi:hypothetical protein
MRQLWSNAANLLWQHPILWLPLLFADLSAFSLGEVQKLLAYAIAVWSLQEHSVLGNAPYTNIHRDTSQVWEQLLTSSSGLLIQFLSVCLYTAAFLITANLVRLFLQNLSPNAWSAVKSANLRLPAIFSFSLKLFVLSFVIALFITTPLYFFFFRSHLGSTVATPPHFAYGLTLLVSLCVAWIITPAAITLLRPPNFKPITSKTIMRGIGSSILTVIASTTLAFLAQIAQRSLLSNSAHMQPIAIQAIHAIASLLTSVPYIFLFIVLALLATSDVDDAKLQTPNPA